MRQMINASGRSSSSPFWQPPPALLTAPSAQAQSKEIKN